MNLRRIAYYLYPFLIGLLVPTLFYLALRAESEARAGNIRKVEISQERPLVVRLAQGRTTVISFAVRPEKVVPGNPQALEINFLGKDLTLRPLGARPGNLIIYTKSSRYVILLQVGPENSYDDVVSVTGLIGRGRPIHLMDDSYRIEQFKVVSSETKKEEIITGQIRQAGRVFQTQDLPRGVKCKGCIVKAMEEFTEIACSKEITQLECQGAGNPVTIGRIKP